MAKRKTKAQAVVEETGVSWEDFKERAIQDAAYEPKAELEPDLELLEEEPVEEEEVKLPNSVVAPKFKDKYIANAIAQGEKNKAARRSNWDWLAQEIAKRCLDSKGKIDIDIFKRILDWNGVDHSKWTNRNKGWEGRFRMTGRVALQKKVANQGVLFLEGSPPETPPEEWVAKYKTKA